MSSCIMCCKLKGQVHRYLNINSVNIDCHIKILILFFNNYILLFFIYIELFSMCYKLLINLMNPYWIKVLIFSKKKFTDPKIWNGAVMYIYSNSTKCFLLWFGVDFNDYNLLYLKTK